MRVAALKFFVTCISFLLFLNFTTGQCLPPGSLQVTSTDWRHFHLAWTDVPGATGYAVAWQHNHATPILTEVPASPTTYDLDLGSILGPTDTLVIQVQTICGEGPYSVQAITVFVTNNQIGVSAVSKPIYIIIDDIVIGLEPPLNICLPACSPWFSLRQPSKDGGQWIGQLPNAASRYLKDAFCNCLSNPRKTETMCLAEAYIDEVSVSSILSCGTNSLDRTMPVPRTPSQILIAPNPCSDHLRVRIQATENTPALLRFLDFTGTVLYAQQHFLFSGANDLDIPVADFPAGLLYYDLQMDGHTDIRGKIVKIY